MTDETRRDEALAACLRVLREDPRESRAVRLPGDPEGMPSARVTYVGPGRCAEGLADEYVVDLGRMSAREARRVGKALRADPPSLGGSRTEPSGFRIPPAGTRIVRFWGPASRSVRLPSFRVPGDGGRR